MLEIGAASGFNLSLYPDKDRFGVEPSKRNCALAKKFYGVDMFSGMFDQFLSSNRRSFDLIFTSHVLEHIVNLMRFVEQCAAICNRFMFIEVPCFDVTFFDEPFGFFSDEHVNAFTLQSLWNLMHAAGFSFLNAKLAFAMKLANTSHMFSLVSLWSKKAAHRKPRLVNDAELQLSNYLDASEFLWRRVSEKIDRIPNDERLAVWGVGNHLFKLLANSSLIEKNIVRVYDSDRHKHGHLVCGIPITAFDPNDVSSRAIDSILITTYSAQPSIKKYIDRLALPIKVRTLYDLPSTVDANIKTAFDTH